MILRVEAMAYELNHISISPLLKYVDLILKQNLK